MEDAVVVTPSKVKIIQLVTTGHVKRVDVALPTDGTVKFLGENKKI